MSAADLLLTAALPRNPDWAGRELDRAGGGRSHYRQGFPQSYHWRAVRRVVGVAGEEALVAGCTLHRLCEDVGGRLRALVSFTSASYKQEDEA